MTEQATSDPRPEWLINVQAPGTTVQHLEVDGQPYTYTLIRAGLEPRLPFTVGYLTENALMIAQDSPETIRPFILTHEVREKHRFADLPEAERCQAALQAELADVQEQMPDQYDTYVADRTIFFDALVALYEQPEQAKAVTPEFIAGIQASREYLQSRLAN